MKDKRFLGANITFILGILVLLSGISQASSALIAGLVMIIGSFAYKSAKKRKLNLAESSTTRMIFELIAVSLIILSVLLSDRVLLIEDPFPNLIIPIWAIIAYIVANLKKNEVRRD